MNHMTLITDPEAPWNERESNDRIKCECGCERWVDDIEPCIIDGRYLSDICASNLTALKTKKLK